MMQPLIISDIIYNENTHIVSIFKDYLILDDISEFLKRYYMHNESTDRIPKVVDFYEKHSKVFPNYVQVRLKMKAKRLDFTIFYDLAKGEQVHV